MGQRRLGSGTAAPPAISVGCRLTHRTRDTNLTDMSYRDYSQLSLTSTFKFCRCGVAPHWQFSTMLLVCNYSNYGCLNGQSEFILSRVYYRNDSVPPDNPYSIRFRQRITGMNRVHVSYHVGGSEQRLGALPGGDDIGEPQTPAKPTCLCSGKLANRKPICLSDRPYANLPVLRQTLIRPACAPTSVCLSRGKLYLRQFYVV